MNYIIDFDKSDKKTKKFKIVLSINGKKKTTLRPGIKYYLNFA
jgi:hypothetical protein